MIELLQNLDKFVLYLRDVRQYSNHTITNYSNDIRQFNLFLDSYNFEEIIQINHIHIRSWMVSLVAEKFSSKSINRKISSLRAFFKFLKRNEVIVKNPMLKIIAPKVSKRLPSYIDKSKINEILDDNLICISDYSTAREKVIISLLYHTGMRRSELLGLKLNDLDFNNKTLKVLGKGNKERLIPLNDGILKDLQDYLEIRENEFPNECDFVILTDKGLRAYPKLIYNIVNNILKKYNASDKASPHVLRHTFATHLTAGGAELNAVKELLGHSSLAATQVYTHNSIERLKEVYDRSHPKAN